MNDLSSMNIRRHYAVWINDGERWDYQESYNSYGEAFRAIAQLKKGYPARKARMVRWVPTVIFDTGE